MKTIDKDYIIKSMKISSSKATDMTDREYEEGAAGTDQEKKRSIKGISRRRTYDSCKNNDT